MWSINLLAIELLTKYIHQGIVISFFTKISDLYIHFCHLIFVCIIPSYIKTTLIGACEKSSKQTKHYEMGQNSKTDKRQERRE